MQHDQDSQPVGSSAIIIAIVQCFSSPPQLPRASTEDYDRSHPTCPLRHWLCYRVASTF